VRKLLIIAAIFGNAFAGPSDLGLPGLIGGTQLGVPGLNNESAPSNAGSTYIRFGGTFHYKRPGGTFNYLRP
jgi:hypothetical protein